MKCPVCRDATLVMADRQGVEIDYCPDCRGVWLDRGELDKIIARAAGAPSAPRSPEPPLALGRPVAQPRREEPPRDDDRREPARAGRPRRRDDDDDRYDDRRDERDDRDRQPRRKRMGSLLEELFDF